MVRLVELPATLDGSDLDGAVRHLATDLLPVGLDQLVVDYRRIGARARRRRRRPAADPHGRGSRRRHRPPHAGARRRRPARPGHRALGPGDGLGARSRAAARRGDPLRPGRCADERRHHRGRPAAARARGLGRLGGDRHRPRRARRDQPRGGPRPHRRRSASAPAPPPSGEPDELEANVAQQVREGLRRVVAEVQSSRGVYAARPDACAIGGVVLTGSMTTWPGVAQALEDELHLPVIVADRESWPQIDGLGAAPERLDVVVGLSRATEALRPDLRPPGQVELRQRPAHRRRRAASRQREPPAARRSGRRRDARPRRRGDRLPRRHLQPGQLAIASVCGEIATELVSAEQKTAALKPYDDFAKAAAERHDAVASVAKARFKWDRTLTEIARVAPDNVWLTSMDGTLAATTGRRRPAARAAAQRRCSTPDDQARRLRRARAQRARLHRPSAPHDGRHRGRLQPRGEARQEGAAGGGARRLLQQRHEGREASSSRRTSSSSRHPAQPPRRQRPRPRRRRPPRRRPEPPQPRRLPTRPPRSPTGGSR